MGKYSLFFVKVENKTITYLQAIFSTIIIICKKQKFNKLTLINLNYYI